MTLSTSKLIGNTKLMQIKRTIIIRVALVVFDKTFVYVKSKPLHDKESFVNKR
jgi:hypothetical protein